MTVQFVKFADGEVCSITELEAELFEKQMATVNPGMMNLDQKSGKDIAIMLVWTFPLGLAFWAGLIWLLFKIFS